MANALTDKEHALTESVLAGCQLPLGGPDLPL